MKVMLIVFFNNKGLIHWEHAENQKTVNSDLLNGWFLHHNNAPCQGHINREIPKIFTAVANLLKCVCAEGQYFEGD